MNRIQEALALVHETIPWIPDSLQDKLCRAEKLLQEELAVQAQHGLTYEELADVLAYVMASQTKKHTRKEKECFVINHCKFLDYDHANSEFICRVGGQKCSEENCFLEDDK